VRNLKQKVSLKFEVGTDWHPDPQGERVVVASEHVFNVAFGLGVKRAVKVGRVFLGKANAAAHLVLVVVRKDAACGKVGEVNASAFANVSYVERTQHVGPQRVNLVAFAPVDVWSPSDACSANDVRWLECVNLGLDACTVVETAL